MYDSVLAYWLADWRFGIYSCCSGFVLSIPETGVVNLGLMSVFSSKFFLSGLRFETFTPSIKHFAITIAPSDTKCVSI